MMDIENMELKALFAQIDKIGRKRYHKLTPQDFEDYRKFDFWRYVNGDYECGTTKESKDWVRSHSDRNCPVCNDRYSYSNGGKTVDHLLPRAQYPWLSLEFKNLWVICRYCNREKGEMHWYEYERFIFLKYTDRYPIVKSVRPTFLLESLKAD